MCPYQIKLKKIFYLTTIIFCFIQVILWDFLTNDFGIFVLSVSLWICYQPLLYWTPFNIHTWVINCPKIQLDYHPFYVDRSPERPVDFIVCNRIFKPKKKELLIKIVWDFSYNVTRFVFIPFHMGFRLLLLEFSLIKTDVQWEWNINIEWEFFFYFI